MSVWYVHRCDPLLFAVNSAIHSYVRLMSAYEIFTMEPTTRMTGHALAVQGVAHARSAGILFGVHVLDKLHLDLRMWLSNSLLGMTWLDPRPVTQRALSFAASYHDGIRAILTRKMASITSDC
jgi:hypothetical protein